MTDTSYPPIAALVDNTGLRSWTERHRYSEQRRYPLRNDRGHYSISER